MSVTTTTKSMDLSTFGPDLVQTFGIGTHISKLKTVYLTLQSLPSLHLPYQIFLGNPQSSAVNVQDSDLALSLDYITKHNLSIFIHSPYILNLAKDPTDGDNYIVACLSKLLKAGAAFGSKGVVVHVGKSVKMKPTVALEHMRHNVKESLEAATIQCPLLIETPAGQGTEMLLKIEDLCNFIESFKDDRLGLCLDTCHVFATGACPLKALQTVLQNPTWKNYLKLIHFNDSKGTCGSCVDRHAFLGTGCMDPKIIVQIAELANAHRIPMVIE